MPGLDNVLSSGYNGTIRGKEGTSAPMKKIR